MLNGKELDKEEIKKIKIAEQTSSVKYSNNASHDQASKEMKRLFSSKVLLPNETNCNNSISSKKLVDLKKSNEINQASIDTDYSSKLKDHFMIPIRNFMYVVMVDVVLKYFVII